MQMPPTLTSEVSGALRAERPMASKCQAVGLPMSLDTAETAARHTLLAGHERHVEMTLRRVISPVRRCFQPGTVGATSPGKGPPCWDWE